ncbi:glycosyltransferase family 4 protein [Lactococcus raffinolactis]|jgi:glycosyltransferase involved in cell wall biosynthesis|uniref:glycosyltransferase family 4 protein n=1 Tax=Pseudolactococcus raffinolactis TaxID=1366 RepID=UPI000BB48F66|nr:glycosyltransferase family 4 protein [Lactococcus raffinolactis]ATC61370.1 exopolysaccharide biosynthesis protein [Lactococcus raffinolactis]
MKQKLLLIIEAMSGGAGRHVQDLISHLSQEKFEIFVIYSNHRTNPEFLEKTVTMNEQASFVSCDFLVREINPKYDLLAYQFIAKKIKQIKPDIVHCHSSKAGVIGRLAAKRRGVKKIFYTPHAYSFLAPEFSGKKKFLFVQIEKFLSRFMTTQTFCVSKGEMQAALEVNLDKTDKFQVIYNGLPEIDLPSKETIRAQLGLEKTVVVIGNNARMSEQKNPMFFMEIAQKMIRQNANWHFVWAGDGQLMPLFQSFIKQNGLEKNIHLLGERPDSETVVTAYDIFLTTSQYEGLPYAPIEAMRAGVPILATNVVGNSELVIEGKNGYLIDLEWSKSVEEKLYKAAKMDAQMIKADFRQRFAIDQMLKQIETEYVKKA